jgi:hypothetical protein
LAVDLWAFLDALVYLHLIGGVETILRAFCSSALWQIYETWYLLFRMQEFRFTTPQYVGIIVLSMGNEILIICLWSPDQTKYPTALGERSDDSSSCFVLTMGQQAIWVMVLESGVDPCSLHRPLIEWDGGIMSMQR